MRSLSALRRPLAALAVALLCTSLTGCGQTGKLFLREPTVTFPLQTGTMPKPPKLILLPAGTTGLVPVVATRLPPEVATRLPPVAVTLTTPPAHT